LFRNGTQHTPASALAAVAMNNLFIYLVRNLTAELFFLNLIY